jgi:hypothetical protein
MSDWGYAAINKTDTGEPIYDGEDAATPPLVDTKSVFDEGFQIAYSKEGVCSVCYVTGTLLVKSGGGATYTTLLTPAEEDNPAAEIQEDGSTLEQVQSIKQPDGSQIGVFKITPPEETEIAIDIPETTTSKQITIRITSNWGREVLKGQDVAMTASISEDYKLADESQIAAYGKRELYKTIQNARGATWESTRVPLKVEPGMTLVGESSLYGTISLYVTSMSRTTDAQQGTITTSITGTIAYSAASSEIIDLEEDMGWV